MGEPLLYKTLEDIIQICHDHNLKLNLTTNGTFPRKGRKFGQTFGSRYV